MESTISDERSKSATMGYPVPTPPTPFVVDCGCLEETAAATVSHPTADQNQHNDGPHDDIVPSTLLVGGNHNSLSSVQIKSSCDESSKPPKKDFNVPFHQNDAGSDIEDFKVKAAKGCVIPTVNVSQLIPEKTAVSEVGDVVAEGDDIIEEEDDDDSSSCFEAESSTSSTTSSTSCCSSSSSSSSRSNTCSSSSSSSSSFDFTDHSNNDRHCSPDCIVSFKESSSSSSSLSSSLMSCSRHNETSGHQSRKKQWHLNLRFDLENVQVIIFPRVGPEDWPMVYYDQDEIAEFRYQRFLEDNNLSLEED